jgi:hypothetical protein
VAGNAIRLVKELGAVAARAYIHAVFKVKAAKVEILAVLDPVQGRKADFAVLGVAYDIASHILATYNVCEPLRQRKIERSKFLPGFLRSCVTAKVPMLHPFQIFFFGELLVKNAIFLLP